MHALCTEKKEKDIIDNPFFVIDAFIIVLNS